MKLYEITEGIKQLSELFDSHSDSEGNCTIDDSCIEEMNKDLDSLNIDLKEKAKSLSWLRKANLDKIDRAKKEKDRLDKIIKSSNRRIDWIEDYIKHTMVILDKNKIELETSTIVLQKNNPSVEIIDVNKLNHIYVNQVVTSKIDKKYILQDLKAGKDIEGVVLVTDKTHLRFK